MKIQPRGRAGLTAAYFTRSRTGLAAAFCLALSLTVSESAYSQTSWKAGTARAAITPKEPMWMAGYAARTRPSDGTVHDLWAKALAIEDPAGRRALLITLDLCGIGRELSLGVREAIRSRHGLDRDRVVLACSHTHSGPVVDGNLDTMYRFTPEQRRQVAGYTKGLERAILDVAARALATTSDARLVWGTGRCDFAVNRRNNKEADVPALKRRMALEGPVDHDVPVLRVAGADGSIAAIVFGYACHCTVLDGYQFCGDYAGFAAIELERRHRGAQAMFVAGCGGDQNPIPRRTLDLAARYGTELAESVAATLAGPLKPLNGPLESRYEEIPLVFATLPTRTQLERDAESSDFYVARRAKHLLEKLVKGGALEHTYPYPVQAWRFGDLNWIFLGGEVVVDYALRIKRNLGSSHTWVSAYCNDVMAYIPSRRVLKEGGYEGGGAMVYYGLPAPWSDDVEEAIVAAVGRNVIHDREKPAPTPARQRSGR